MLRVKTIVKPSPLHGEGLFAAEFIAAGRLVWAFDHRKDWRVPVREVDADFLHYAYINRKMPAVAVDCADDARYWNFHEQPNCGEAEPPRIGFESPIVALRDIQPGEELTIEFNSDADAARKMKKESPCLTHPQ